MNVAAYLFVGLAIASFASLLLKHPWTIWLARRHTPPEVWATPLFFETNLIITAAWAVLFLGGAAVSILTPLWVHLAYGAILLVLGRLSPNFGSWYSSRRLRAMGSRSSQ